MEPAFNAGGYTGGLLDAIHFAAGKHRDQRRKNEIGAPFINHPIGVAHILWYEAEIRNIYVLMAAVLHDTVEDTSASHAELTTTFGSRVANIVKEVTDDKSLSKDLRKRNQVSHAKHISIEAKLVKLADKLYNLRDLKECPPAKWSVERIQGYFVWCQAVVKSLSGSNKNLEAALKDLFETGTFSKGAYVESSGKIMKEDIQSVHPCVPKNTDLTVFLEKYYAAMKIAGTTKDN